MNGFKLLAVIPLKGCDSKFRKNLQIGEVYKFYQNYDIILNDDKSNVLSVVKDSINEYDELYNLENGIQVNVSAIVGTNGAGKSTLIELFYYFLYVLGIKNVFNGNPILFRNSPKLFALWKEMTKDLNELKTTTEKVLTAIKIQNKYELVIDDYAKLTEEKYVEKVISEFENKIIFTYKQKEDDKHLENKILNKLNVCIVFETNEGMFSGKYYNSEFSFNCIESYKPKSKHKTLNLEDFFYSICLNYSHHSLNSTTIGNWVNNLFHKNDAYTTPVVINPMRDEGNFNINSELHLSNERLMSNLVYDIINNKDYRLLDKYNVVKIIFRVKKSIAPLPLEFTKEGFDDLVSINLLKKYLGITHISKYYPFLDNAIGYLEKKIPKLKEQYPQLFNNDKGVINEELFNSFLQEDKSHITKKIRQTLNFIKYTYNNSNTPWNEPTTEFSNHLSIEDFIEWMKICDKNYKKLSPIELMNYALPGFFNVDFNLKTENSKEIFLSQLSSGEQQMIFNINSITYHLYNLQSIHTNERTGVISNRIKYKNIAVVLDEIELYYHPNMQRELVKNILQSFELIKNNGEAGIESINLSFLTHSPFILSDIPNNNILRLSLNDKGESIIDDNNSRTFGANIHDLLVDSFFMPSTTGKFAQIKIKEIVDFYYRVKSNEIEKHVLVSKYKEKQKEFHYILNIIGEDVIKGIIENHIQFIEDSLLDNNKKSRIERLEEEIALKKNEINRLEQDD
jgi:hypothetical protein